MRKVTASLFISVDGVVEDPHLSQTFKTGVLYLVYGPDEAPPEGGYEEAIQAHAEATSQE